MSNGIGDEFTSLVLQGGGAMGAYQAGVFEALAGHDLTPGWLAGISIGGVNAAIIAGNPPEQRVPKLRAFWDSVSTRRHADVPLPNARLRRLANGCSAAAVLAFGVPGFFRPRFPPAPLRWPGTRGALSFYDLEPLRDTLRKLIDFDRLNDGEVRLSLGAVNVETGNFNYFDSARERIEPEHVMAGGALPPGLPPIEIDGQHYWDGGLVSNTPLQYLLDSERQHDMCVFQVDLFCARGPLPENLLDVYEREKDIRYSSRTRLNTDAFRRTQELRRAVHRLLEKLPASLADDEDVRQLREADDDAAITIVHLINRRQRYHSHQKDYEFSARSIREHWDHGFRDACRTLAHPRWKERRKPTRGVTVLDLTGADP